MKRRPKEEEIEKDDYGPPTYVPLGASPTEYLKLSRFHFSEVSFKDGPPEVDEEAMWKLAEWSQRSEATKFSGARLPEQRRAGQLVSIYRDTGRSLSRLVTGKLSHLFMLFKQLIFLDVLPFVFPPEENCCNRKRHLVSFVVVLPPAQKRNQTELFM